MKPDEGHNLTEKELAKLELRIASVYGEAAKELQETVDNYFRQFEKRDAEMKELIGTVVNGKEWTERDYKQWRLNQIGRGERFKALQKRLAERYTEANQTAVRYVNDATPGIYSLNRNYAAYTIESVSGDVGFDLWDEQTVKRLIKGEPDLMPYYPAKRALNRGIDLAYGKRQISACVTSSILQGKSIKGMADDLQTRIPTMNRNSAIRTARTAVTNAQNAGRQDSYVAATKMGIEMEREWVSALDARTRPEHAEADGQVVGVDEPFIVGGEKLMFPGDRNGSGWNTYNCFVGDTKIASDSKAIRSYKHQYSGDLITIKSAAGVEFTCTLNHPILTPRGWVHAELLKNGDDLLVTSAGEMNMLGVNPNINHTFPRIDAIHEFFSKVGVKRTCGLGVNFHGDVPASDVEIITKKRFLRGNRDSRISNRINKFMLKHPNASFLGKSAFVKHFRSILASPLSFIRSKRVFLPLFFGHVPHSDDHGFRPSPDMDIVLPEYSVDDLPAETMVRSELLNRLSGKVFVDKVVSVEISPANTHVYNLQTESGYYFVNSSIPQNKGKCNGIFAIAKNCRCTQIARVKNVPEATERRSSDGVIKNMTFKEWMKNK